jgi:high-affinity K+ transport system ATPase subunit B
MFLISRKREPNQTFIRLVMCEEPLCFVIFIFSLSCVPGFLIKDKLEALSLVILKVALIEGAIGEPKEAEAILFI